MWATVALVLATAIICSSTLKTRRLIMTAAADNARQLAQFRDQLSALAPTFQRGLGEVTSLIEKLRRENAELNTPLDFGPLAEAVAPLQAAADALDAVVPDPVVQDPEPADEAPADAPADDAPADDSDTPPLPPEDEAPAVDGPEAPVAPAPVDSTDDPESDAPRV